MQGTQICVLLVFFSITLNSSMTKTPPSPGHYLVSAFQITKRLLQKWIFTIQYPPYHINIVMCYALVYVCHTVLSW